METLLDFVQADENFKLFVINEMQLNPVVSVWTDETLALILYSYADFIKKPYEVGEKIISKSDRFSYKYATTVLKKRFILGEPTIKNSSYKSKYITFVQSITSKENFFLFKLEF